MSESYPTNAHDRDRWIEAHRGPRARVESTRPFGCLVEPERADNGEVVPVATVFLVNRECPWRCLMCDLWRNTLTETIAPGAIPAQLDAAMKEFAAHRPAPRQIKLYNSGSFFDAGAIPPSDHAAIATQVASFDRVIVENHPALVGEAVLRFRDRLAGRLEVAMGLETVHPEVLPRLNKRMTLQMYSRAARLLGSAEIAIRSFILVQPPFLPPSEALPWAQRSVEFAFDHGASAAVLIPTRLGNGALESLATRGEFSEPALATIESALENGIRLGRGRVFADLWDLRRFASCDACYAPRRARLERMNLTQRIEPLVLCAVCGHRNVQA